MTPQGRDTASRKANIGHHSIATEPRRVQESLTAKYHLRTHLANCSVSVCVYTPEDRLDFRGIVREREILGGPKHGTRTHQGPRSEFAIMREKMREGYGCLMLWHSFNTACNSDGGGNPWGRPGQWFAVIVLLIVREIEENEVARIKQRTLTGHRSRFPAGKKGMALAWSGSLELGDRTDFICENIEYVRTRSNAFSKILRSVNAEPNLRFRFSYLLNLEPERTFGSVRFSRLTIARKLKFNIEGFQSMSASPSTLSPRFRGDGFATVKLWIFVLTIGHQGPSTTIEDHPYKISRQSDISAESYASFDRDPHRGSHLFLTKPRQPPSPPLVFHQFSTVSRLQGLNMLLRSSGFISDTAPPKDTGCRCTRQYLYREVAEYPVFALLGMRSKKNSCIRKVTIIAKVAEYLVADSRSPRSATCWVATIQLGSPSIKAVLISPWLYLPTYSAVLQIPNCTNSGGTCCTALIVIHDLVDGWMGVGWAQM
ncbi:hypothetical protein B0H19DRAFT_1086342 [Mycena capillaripes]|nr:hypothetical protein B0H19DRAFT_1086342 [Mycena capillaripes]